MLQAAVLIVGAAMLVWMGLDDVGGWTALQSSAPEPAVTDVSLLFVEELAGLAGLLADELPRIVDERLHLLVLEFVDDVAVSNRGRIVSADVFEHPDCAVGDLRLAIGCLRRLGESDGYENDGNEQTKQSTESHGGRHRVGNRWISGSAGRPK